ncbi:leucine-rich repeat domain-containing protein [Sorangium cellulosum]|uniref:leucine-rich repeat domain-containing protein n=1 Tax=Sorangium cellulosum TaxID=56 RepID=UPI0013316CFF|nr:leucine-rich repeat domain-containing protein [Sorangium cellulosum]
MLLAGAAGTGCELAVLDPELDAMGAHGSPLAGGAAAPTDPGQAQETGGADGIDAAACTGALQIADPALEAALREAAGKPTGPLYPDDFASLDYVDVSSSGIESLSGIECLTSVTSLYLGHNLVTDLTPLSSLTELRFLSLESNQITDVSPLSSLVNLEQLSLNVNAISDVTPLGSLTNLYFLSLSLNPITDVSPLGALVELDKLYLVQTSVTTLAPLSGLSALTVLVASDSEITDISGLSTMTNLRWVALSNNNISNVYPLVANLGIGQGDSVFLLGNPINCDSASQAINLERLWRRGVELYTECPRRRWVTLP